MKAMSFVLLLMAIVVFVLSGCSDNTVPVAAPNDGPAAPVSATSLAKEGILHSATGGGHIFAWYIDGTRMEFNGLVTFGAIQHADGSFSGAMQHHAFPWNISFKGKIIDLKVEEVEGGRLAKMSWSVHNLRGLPAGLNLNTGITLIFDSDNGENEFHTVVGLWPDGGMFGYTIQELVDMTPAEWIAFLTNIGGGGYTQYIRQHGNWTVR